MSRLEDLKLLIKEKKELRGISDSILDKKISDFISKKRINLSNLSDKDLKLISKEIRLDLRLMHGRFQLNISKRKSLIKRKDYKDLLKTHLSSKERISFYENISSIVKEINPRSIIDIACGLNPIALASKDVEYTAIDINQEEIDILNDFFASEKIKGKALCLDATKLSFPSLHADLCLIFKFLDFISDSNRVAEDMLKSIDSKYFLVSFATKSLSGKRRVSKRIWFERIVHKLGFSFKIYEYENEIFYLVKKQQI